MIFKYTIDPDVPEPIMLINKHIGYDDEDGEGIIGSEFERELLQFDSLGKRRVKVYINSTGGSVIDAMSIYQAILNSKVPVDTYNMGFAISSGGIIFQAGRVRYMADYAYNMLHNPSGGSKKSLDAFRESIVMMISTRCGLSKDQVSDLMARESWIDAKESKELNLCDVIENSSIKNLDATDIKMAWKEANNILNAAFPKKTPVKKMEDLKKINNILSLNEEASVTATVAEIEKIKNASTHQMGRIKEMENALETKKKEAEEMENKLCEYKNKLEEKEKEAQDALASEAKNKAEVLVSDAVKAGKIKNDAKESFVKMAIADFAGAEAIINGIATTVKTTKLLEVSKEILDKDIFAGATNAQKEMARIQAKLQGKIK